MSQCPHGIHYDNACGACQPPRCTSTAPSAPEQPADGCSEQCDACRVAEQPHLSDIEHPMQHAKPDAPEDPTTAKIDELSRQYGRVAWLTGGQDLRAFARALLASQPAAPYVPDAADLYCVERGGDGMLCATGCTCGKVAPIAVQDDGITAFTALQTIIDFPITDPANMDAADMKLIAIDAMTGKSTQPSAAPVEAAAAGQDEPVAYMFNVRYVGKGKGSEFAAIDHIVQAGEEILSKRPLVYADTRPPVLALTDEQCERIRIAAATHADSWAESQTSEPTQTQMSGEFVRAIIEAAKGEK